jgi:excisionase family DNA binding protein
MSEGSELLRVSEVAELLGVSASRIYQLLAARELPSVRVGGAIRVPRSAWESWIKSRSEAALAALRDAPTARASRS